MIEVKKFITIFNNSRNGFVAGGEGNKLCWYTGVKLDLSLYEKPDFAFLGRHEAKCELWNEWDEDGNEKINTHPEYEPTEEEFKKFNEEKEKLKVILSEVWAQAVAHFEAAKPWRRAKNPFQAMVLRNSHEWADIIYRGHGKYRCDSFHPVADDWANVGLHEKANQEVEQQYDIWLDQLAEDGDEENLKACKEQLKQKMPWKYKK